ncbi:MAG: YfhO family protein [Ignavibacteriae bacterium]|nr:YfhO family protein [Ignavibacteriota bacterium]
MTKKIKKLETEKPTVSYLDNIPKKYRDIIAVIIILIPLLYFFLPFAINSVSPTGTDVLANLGQTHNWVEWNKKNGETALWNPAIFGGEPIYNRLTPTLIHVDSLLAFLGKIFYWGFWYLFIGGLGIYYLLEYKNIPWYLAVIAAVAFVLLPDWQAQIGEGHNSKLRALMILPWFILSFSYFFENKTWLSTGLFALVFSWLVRTHHFQIIFYGILVLFFLYVYPTILLFIKKEFKQAGNLILKFTIALTLTFLTTAQPLFTTNEYAKYTIRGGNPVQIGEDAKSAKEAKGVDLDYATGWSFAPNEVFDFFLPHFSGGISSELYNGDKYPQLKGRQIPTYWGQKPFSGNYATMGMILFLFAIIGVIYNRKDKFVIGLAVFAIFSILLSFGKHFETLYSLFFYYVPYFSKFRAPAMILNVTFPVILILSGYGLKAIIENNSAKDKQIFFATFLIGLASILVILFTYSSYGFTTVNEAAQYDANTINLLKEIRKELLTNDIWNLIIILGLTIAIITAYIYRKINTSIFVVLVLVISAFELFIISQKAHSIIPLNNLEQLEKSEFKQTSITQELQNADKSMRAIVLGRDFTSNHYAYFYNLISGYSAIKLQIIQDVIEHNLYAAQSQDRINWNIINMMSGKYVIAPAQLNYPLLTIATQDNERKEIMYKNINAQPKAWFVKEVRKMQTPEEIVLFMNSPNFKPDSSALVLNSSNISKINFDGNGDIKLVEHNPNFVELEVNTNSEQFMVLSEIFYPEGWKANIDNTETTIHQTNHILRGIQVPAGKHKITFEFKPQTYYTSLTFLWIGNIIILGLILIPGIFNFKKKNI